MVTYDTNFMGPISTKWYTERGLTQKVTKIADANQAKIWKINEGDEFVVDEIMTCYAGGRIDIRDYSKEGYDGWGEYGLAPMHGEDWNALSNFLLKLETETVLPYQELIDLFEADYGRKIRWGEDIKANRFNKSLNFCFINKASK